MKETKQNSITASGKPVKKGKTHGEEYAAIAMALHSYFGELHDNESDVITIKNVNKTNSEWCSKILNMRNLR